jgi:hypothetical protein
MENYEKQYGSSNVTDNNNPVKELRDLSSLRKVRSDIMVRYGNKEFGKTPSNFINVYASNPKISYQFVKFEILFVCTRCRQNASTRVTCVAARKPTQIHVDLKLTTSGTKGRSSLSVFGKYVVRNSCTRETCDAT